MLLEKMRHANKKLAKKHQENTYITETTIFAFVTLNMCSIYKEFFPF